MTFERGFLVGFTISRVSGQFLVRKGRIHQRRQDGTKKLQVDLLAARGRGTAVRRPLAETADLSGIAASNHSIAIAREVRAGIVEEDTVPAAHSIVATRQALRVARRVAEAYGSPIDGVTKKTLRRASVQHGLRVEGAAFLIFRACAHPSVDEDARAFARSVVAEATAKRCVATRHVARVRREDAARARGLAQRIHRRVFVDVNDLARACCCREKHGGAQPSARHWKNVTTLTCCSSVAQLTPPFRESVKPFTYIEKMPRAVAVWAQPTPMIFRSS